MEKFPIEPYKKYFELPQVTNVANKIFDAIKNGNELQSDEERMASIALAWLKLNEYYNRR